MTARLPQGTLHTASAAFRLTLVVWHAPARAGMTSTVNNLYSLDWNFNIECLSRTSATRALSEQSELSTLA